jgi:hypothetical protein
MALFHDHVPASALKIQSVWVDREVNILGRTTEDGDIKDKATFGWRVENLGELATMVEVQMK